MLKRLVLVLAFATLALAGQARAADQGTPDEAKAMAEKAAAYLKEHGKDAAYKAFDDGADGFRDRDLYVFVVDSAGTTVAHGANAKLIGKNLLKVKDVNGVYFVKEMMDKSANGGSGWVDYAWPHPETKKITPKTAYVIGLSDVFVGVGAYK